MNKTLRTLRNFYLAMLVSLGTLVGFVTTTPSVATDDEFAPLYVVR